MYISISIYISISYIIIYYYIIHFLLPSISTKKKCNAILQFLGLGKCLVSRVREAVTCVKTSKTFVYINDSS